MQTSALPLGAAGSPFLNGRALGIPVRTEHATITLVRLEQYTAACAFVEKLTRVRGHRLSFRVPALRAGDYRVQCHCLNLKSFVDSRTGRNGSATVGWIQYNRTLFQRGKRSLDQRERPLTAAYQPFRYQRPE